MLLIMYLNNCYVFGIEIFNDTISVNIAHCHRDALI